VVSKHNAMLERNDELVGKYNALLEQCDEWKSKAETVLAAYVEFSDCLSSVVYMDDFKVCINDF
jgi:hypothetical protein